MSNTITDTITELADNKSDIQDALAAKGVTSAGKHGFNKFAEDIASITNQYTSSDEGKVVSGGELVVQTSTTATANGTIDTTTNNEVVVNVPNTYTAGDEGKVVSGGSLVAQTAYPSTITDNGTYDTTENNSVTVNVTGATTEAVTIDNSYFSQQKIFILYDTTIGIYGSCNIRNCTPPSSLTIIYTSNNDLSSLLNKVVYFGSFQHGGQYTITAINSSTKKITLTKGTAMSTFATNPYAVTTLDS